MCFYNIYLHPLSKYPGSKWDAASRIPYCTYLIRGTMNARVTAAHKRYGDVVRIAPDELSYISGDTAWEDIYGFCNNKRGRKVYLKDRTWIGPSGNGSWSLLAADKESHSRIRRLFSHAFSDKALREQEPLIQKYVDLLVHRVGEVSLDGPLDVVKWYNYTTFDIIGDLVLGESLYCLRDKDYHPWVSNVFMALKGIALGICLRIYPNLSPIINRLISQEILARRRYFYDFAYKQYHKRLANETDRPDFVSYVERQRGPKGVEVSQAEMDATYAGIMIAGSETTATVLSGTTWFLLQNPEIYQRLRAEIREKFQRNEDITMEAVNQCSYLIACLSEGMRLYPPVTTGFPRIVPAGGDTISGKYVPAGTRVYVSQFASNHSERNFVEPQKYAPERWLEDPYYAADKKSAYNPFSFGPRNCIGKHLAYVDMRLIMAKLLLNYDFELVDKEFEWIETQKVYTTWEKQPLMVKVIPAERT
ncbi:isotrichodermin C-15 hydroxylase [Patellaria atrata CBS 101060]|uniref:Isotrichodermin C-15 hydroxylase n=1 Tax=Patellaria atrata CBS 101060 TaxID=1346257 RepID=A0A9P4S4I7_9PEZI|nr:isotrichodermin C-15 hydroxylase [Patellaria atrata CBS 101060]